MPDDRTAPPPPADDAFTAQAESLFAQFGLPLDEGARPADEATQKSLADDADEALEAQLNALHPGLL